MNVVLIEPEIPWNTGNTARTCLAVGAKLHIIGRPSFSLASKHIQRAGLDYWDYVKLTFYEDLSRYLELHEHNPFYFFSAHGTRIYTEISFTQNDSIIFGKESVGLDPEIHEKYYDRICKIPVEPPIRSLNLSTAVGIVLYEAKRQIASIQKL